MMVAIQHQAKIFHLRLNCLHQLLPVMKENERKNEVADIKNIVWLQISRRRNSKVKF